MLSSKVLKEDNSKVAVKTLAVLQPGYLPWLGFFDQLLKADIFVLYDDVQFDKSGWRNRNRIKSPSGPHWLTVPVRVSHLGQSILEVEIDNRLPWARKHLGTISQFYKRAPYFQQYFSTLEELLHRKWELIVDLDIALIEQFRIWLNLTTTIVRSSELNVPGDRSTRLLNLCSLFKANQYISGDAARSYLDVDLFEQHGVQVQWQQYVHPIYPQGEGEFVPYLSTLDLLLNCGDASRSILAAEATAQ